EIANIDPVRTLTRWELLDAQIGKVLPALAGTQQSVGDWLLHPPGQSRPDAKAIDELRHALQSLAGLPTARLERIFVEHLDLLSYRLDTWQMGCFARRLETIRVNSGAPPEATPDAMRNKGLYLGAFGWLEDLRPAPPLKKAELTGIRASW